jgi:hypothetical protein
VTEKPLSPDEVEAFVRDGFVRLAGAFPTEVADDCRAFLAKAVAEETGIDADDPSPWTRPVVRLMGFGAEPFRRAARTARLHSAFDQLVGPGRWVPRDGIGTFPIRFPHPDDPGDAGWHMDGSYTPEGERTYWLNLRSRGRALLMLFLFSDTGPEDAPTRIKVGSHLDVPPFLVPYGERGVDGLELCDRMDAAGALDSPARPTVTATGRAGDVYLCHPFLIHAAQRNRGRRPKFMAQPPLMPTGLLDLGPEPAEAPAPDGPAADHSPVERAVLQALGRQRALGC